MHQSIAIEKRTCKHLRAYRGEAAETERVGVAAAVVRPRRTSSESSADGEAASDANEPPLLLAHKWEMDVDLAGWWMSEKLDGVRAYWDGENFFSRLGNRFHVPAQPDDRGDALLVGIATGVILGVILADSRY